ncbi:peptidyl-tRNA hydrolase 2, mitochondrial [Dorcoceras hygrometricum]|uniref:peptidyl-tRNA hydrolase n=1 Tax=Dorcoceras hygrometricum TaxID=472368 RepID=A0A2Z7AG22_9LAMI|nr:peptidyl-tRNA hydrolase 2, mitochondrial [Dorcoceras hygrometricum]
MSSDNLTSDQSEASCLSSISSAPPSASQLQCNSSAAKNKRSREAAATTSSKHPLFRGVRMRTWGQQKQEKEWLGVSFKPENFIPGLVIGFIVGFFLDLSKPVKSSGSHRTGGKKRHQSSLLSSDCDEDLKMVLVVRQDLKMGAGKIASQCAHAATGIYSELMESHRSLLRQWEVCGQAKIVVTCKNQQEMNKLRDAAERIRLPTFIVADAGRTQVIHCAYPFK